MTERIAVIGGGIGGLSVALSLKAFPCRIVIIERDPPPPAISPDEAFERWERPGVPQFRHAHIFLSRLQTLLRDRHPEVLEALLDAGMELSTLDEVMPAGVVDHIVPSPGDEDLQHLWGRRATFEYVLRRHVEQLAQVEFVHGKRVVGLATESHEDAIRVTGVKLEDVGGAPGAEIMEADIVVDASGKRSKAPQWLSELGVSVDTHGVESGFIYACRHYQVNSPGEAPSRRECGGNLDYLGYSTFFAEHGSYALAFGSPVDEKELVESMCSPDGFEALTEQFPTLSRWRERSEPKSKVMGAGRFQNRWTRIGVTGDKAPLGFFPVGDSQFETNPMYGRGCASAFVQAQVLADVLGEVDDPLVRHRRYTERTYSLLQPYYEISIATDRIYHTRAKRSRGVPVPAGERVLNYLYEAGWLPATHTSALVAREFIKAVQMREQSALGLRLAMGFQVLMALVRTWLGRRLPQLAPPPPRDQFIARVAGAEREPGS